MIVGGLFMISVSVLALVQHRRQHAAFAEAESGPPPTS
jgi:hypothetical protein